MKYTYLMDTTTGSVETKEDWLAQMSEWEVSKDGKTPQERFESLVEVVKNEEGDWIEF